MALKITTESTKPGAIKINLNGSLDSDTAPQLSEALGVVTDDIQIVVFDLKELTFISSAGLRVVFATLKKQKAKGGKVAVSHMSPGVKKVFEIVKALPDFTVFSNVEEMDAYFASFQRD